MVYFIYFKSPQLSECQQHTSDHCDTLNGLIPISNLCGSATRPEIGKKSKIDTFTRLKCLIFKPYLPSDCSVFKIQRKKLLLEKLILTGGERGENSIPLALGSRVVKLGDLCRWNKVKVLGICVKKLREKLQYSSSLKTTQTHLKLFLILMDLLPGNKTWLFAVSISSFLWTKQEKISDFFGLLMPI